MFWDKPAKSLQDRIARLASKMEENHKETDFRLDNIEKVLIAQEINLKEHMRRSDHLEEIAEALKERQDVDREARTTELQPIQKHINMVEGAFKFLGLVGIIVSILGGIAKLFGVI